MAASDKGRKQMSKAKFIAAPGIESSIYIQNNQKVAARKATNINCPEQKRLSWKTKCEEEELLKTVAKVVDVTDSNASDTEKLALLLLPAA